MFIHSLPTTIKIDIVVSLLLLILLLLFFVISFVYFCYFISDILKRNEFNFIRIKIEPIRDDGGASCKLIVRFSVQVEYAFS